MEAFVDPGKSVSSFTQLARLKEREEAQGRRDASKNDGKGMEIDENVAFDVSAGDNSGDGFSHYDYEEIAHANPEWQTVNSPNRKDKQRLRQEAKEQSAEVHGKNRRRGLNIQENHAEKEQWQAEKEILQSERKARKAEKEAGTLGGTLGGAIRSVVNHKQGNSSVNKEPLLDQYKVLDDGTVHEYTAAEKEVMKRVKATKKRSKLEIRLEEARKRGAQESEDASSSGARGESERNRNTTADANESMEYAGTFSLRSGQRPQARPETSEFYMNEAKRQAGKASADKDSSGKEMMGKNSVYEEADQDKATGKTKSDKTKSDKTKIGTEVVAMETGKENFGSNVDKVGVNPNPNQCGTRSTSLEVEDPGLRYRIHPPPPARKPSQNFIHALPSGQKQGSATEKLDKSLAGDPTVPVTKDKSFEIDQPVKPPPVRKPSQNFIHGETVKNGNLSCPMVSTCMDTPILAQTNDNVYGPKSPAELEAEAQLLAALDQSLARDIEIENAMREHELDRITNGTVEDTLDVRMENAPTAGKRKNMEQASIKPVSILKPTSILTPAAQKTPPEMPKRSELIEPENAPQQLAFEPSTGGQQFDILTNRYHTLIRLEIVRRVTSTPAKYSKAITGTILRQWIADSRAVIRSHKNPLQAIRQRSEIPTNAAAGHEFFNIVEVVVGNETKTTITYWLESRLKLDEMKQDKRLMKFLKQEKIFLFTHTHKTINITSIGWVSGRQVFMVDTDQAAIELTDRLARYIVARDLEQGKLTTMDEARAQIPSLELSKSSIPYKTGVDKNGRGIHIRFDVLEIKCEFTHTEQVRALLRDATNAGALPRRECGYFVPYRAKASPELYQATVEQHVEFLANAAGCEVNGVHESYFKILTHCPRQNKEIPMDERLLTATYEKRDSSGRIIRRPILGTIEKTRKSESEGVYRFTFTKESTVAAYNLLTAVFINRVNGTPEMETIAATGHPYANGVRPAEGKYAQYNENKAYLFRNMTSERQEHLNHNFRVANNCMIPSDMGPHAFNPNKVQATYNIPWHNQERTSKLLNGSGESETESMIGTSPYFASGGVANGSLNHSVNESGTQLGNQCGILQGGQLGNHWGDQSMNTTFDASVIALVDAKMEEHRAEVNELKSVVQTLTDINKLQHENAMQREQKLQEEKEEAAETARINEEALHLENQEMQRKNTDQQAEFKKTLKEHTETLDKIMSLLSIQAANQLNQQTRQAPRRHVRRVQAPPRVSLAGASTSPSPEKQRKKRQISTPLKSPSTNRINNTKSPTVPTNAASMDTDTPPSVPTREQPTRNSTPRNLSSLMSAVSTAAKSLMGIDNDLEQAPVALSSLARAVGSTAADENSRDKATINTHTHSPNQRSSSISHMLDESTHDCFEEDEEEQRSRTSHHRKFLEKESTLTASFDGEDDDPLEGSSLLGQRSQLSIRDISSIAPNTSGSETMEGWDDGSDESTNTSNDESIHGRMKAERATNTGNKILQNSDDFADLDTWGESEESGDSSEEKATAALTACYDDMGYEQQGSVGSERDTDSEDSAEVDSVKSFASFDSDIAKELKESCYADMEYENDQEAAREAQRTQGPQDNV